MRPPAATCSLDWNIPAILFFARKSMIRPTCSWCNGSLLTRSTSVRSRSITDGAGAVADETTGCREIAPIVHRGHLLPRREGDEFLATVVEQWVALDEQCNVLLLGKGSKCRINVVIVASGQDKGP